MYKRVNIIEIYTVCVCIYIYIYIINIHKTHVQYIMYTKLLFCM